MDYTSEEFWKDAPEGATHYADFGDETSCFYKMIDGDYSKSFRQGGWRSTSWSYLDVNKNSSSMVNFIPRPQPKPVKPVFTKAMADNGELPPVGSDYLDEDNQVCRAIAHYSKFVIGDMLEHLQLQQYPAISTARVDRINAIDTRTDKEKAIDDIIDVIHDNSGNYAENIFKQIELGKVHGVTFKGEE